MAKAAVHGESYLLALLVESQNFVEREVIANSCLIRTFSNLLFVPRKLKDFVPSDPEEEPRAFDAIASMDHLMHSWPEVYCSQKSRSPLSGKEIERSATTS